MSEKILINKIILPFQEFHDSNLILIKLKADHKKLIENFNKDIENGKIKTEYINCLCGSSTFDKIASIDRYGFSQNTLLCNECGLILSNPRLTPAEYEKFYVSDLYRAVYEENSDYLGAAQERHDTYYGSEVFEHILQICDIDSSKTVFEFGAGGGWNLLKFKEAGATVSGVDYSSGLSKFAREKGINVFQGSLEYIVGRFDIIILNHVFEHFTNPIEQLKMLLKHLKHDGIIYVGVPNILNFSLGQLQNAHAYYFSPTLFYHYLAQAGLQLIQSGDVGGLHMYGIFKLGAAKQIRIERNYHDMIKMLNRFKLRQYLKRILTSWMK